jgi:transcriptional regulator with XRE-family HTH domain
MAQSPAQSRRSNITYVGPDAAFGRVLRAAREGKGLTQDELGHRAGYSRNYVGLVEQGKTSPSLRALTNLAAVLGIRPSVLMRRAELFARKTQAGQE